MEYITKYTLEKLKSVGFCFPEYEHNLNYGMCFYFENCEYIIGGSWDAPLPQLSKKVAREGTWLPDTQQLVEWLQRSGFNFDIRWNDSEEVFTISAVDLKNGSAYTAHGIDLVNGLAKLIYKICKSNLREYTPVCRLTLQIEPNSK